MLRLALIMRDGQTAEQLCLPQRSAKIYLAESQQKVIITEILIRIGLNKIYKLKNKKNKY